MKTARVLAVLLLVLMAPTVARSQHTGGSWQEVGKALGRDGEEKDGVYRVAFPRSDLKMSIGNVQIRPSLALTSWAAFTRAGNATMVMGDLVMTASEVSPVVTRLAEGGVEITAVHNHLIGEEPRVMYLHFHGHGDAVKLAAALHKALAATKTPLGTPLPAPATEPAAPDMQKLSQTLGRAGSTRNGVISFSILRAEEITNGGAALGPRMGVATAINFQLTGAGANVAATGDFVLVATEVQPVIRALREHGIAVTALHNHMLDEQPRLFFLHFWGRGPAEKLGRGLRAALDKTNHAKAQYQ